MANDRQAVLGAVGPGAQTRGQIGEMRVQQLLDPLGGDRHGAGQRQPRMVERQRHRGDLVAAGGDRAILVGEHERAVAGGVQFDRELALQVRQRVVGSTVGLGQSLEAERILQPARRGLSLGECAAGEQSGDPVAGALIARVRAGVTDRGVEGVDVAEHRLIRERGGHLELVERTPAIEQRDAGRSDGERVGVEDRVGLPRSDSNGSRPAARNSGAEIVWPVNASPISAIWLRSAWPTEPIECNRGVTPALSAAHSASATTGRTPA